MSKAWSFFWLVIASVIAIQIIGAMISPYLPYLGIVLVLSVVGFVGFKIYRNMVGARRARRHF